MTTRMLVTLGGIAALAACVGGSAPEAAGSELPQDVTAGGAMAIDDLRCTPSPRMPVEGRTSPYDSTVVQLGDARALVCYGRPSARGRTMIGGELVPYGSLWRTGANEPTIIHLSGPVTLAGIQVPAGSFSIYTIPTENEWTIIVNRSITQWGHEGASTAAIEAQEVGRGTAPSSRIADHVETFTIRTQPAGAGAVDLIMEWEHTRVTVSVRG
jgi:hypothetical protein